MGVLGGLCLPTGRPVRGPSWTPVLTGATGPGGLQWDLSPRDWNQGHSRSSWLEVQSLCVSGTAQGESVPAVKQPPALGAKVLPGIS